MGVALDSPFLRLWKDGELLDGAGEAPERRATGVSRRTISAACGKLSEGRYSAVL
jgi:hypothetical protein